MARQMCLAGVQGWEIKSYGSEGPWALQRMEERGGVEFPSAAEKPFAGLQGVSQRAGSSESQEANACGQDLLGKGEYREASTSRMCVLGGVNRTSGIR